MSNNHRVCWQADWLSKVTNMRANAENGNCPTLNLPLFMRQALYFQPIQSWYWEFDHARH